jgi:hypothetical protein
VASGEAYNVGNAVNHPVAGGFVPGIDEGDKGAGSNMILIHNVVCVPIVAKDGRTIGALEALNKQGDQNPAFTEEDQQVPSRSQSGYVHTYTDQQVRSQSTGGWSHRGPVGRPWRSWPRWWRVPRSAWTSMRVG